MRGRGVIFNTNSDSSLHEINITVHKKRKAKMSQTQTMKAVVYQGTSFKIGWKVERKWRKLVITQSTEPFKVSVEERPLPKLEHPDDCLVKVTTAAICGSDLHMYQGRTAAKGGLCFGKS
jgi:hypothetical protein